MQDHRPPHRCGLFARGIRPDWRLLAPLTALSALCATAVAHAAPGTPVVSDQGDYTANTQELSANWTASDPGGQITAFEYRLSQDSPGGPLLRGWTSAGLATEVTVTGLSLVTGQSYFFHVRANYGVNQHTDSGYSDGIVADGIAPVLHTVVDDGDYTASSESLHANWLGNDVGSGIARYRYAIGTAAGARDVRGWRNVGLDTEVTATGLTLTHLGRYYFTIEVTDLAGNQATGSSNGITVDTEAPQVSNIDDGGDVTGSKTVLSASWSGSDSGAGVRAYRYSIGTARGARNVVGWREVGLNTSARAAGLSLVDGLIYYFNIEARDLADNTRVGYSDGILADHAPPVVTVTDEGDVTANPTRLGASWTGADARSDITEYLYAVGDAGDAQAVVPWTSHGLATEVLVTGLSLEDGGVYFFHVKAVDEASNVGYGLSDGIRVDSSAPQVNVVRDGGDYQGFADSLTASWVATDVGGVGIAEYRYTIGTSPGARDVRGWRSAGLDTSVTVSGLSLADGATYYFAVAAVDNAGRTGTGYSDGIMVDTVSPVIHDVSDAGDYTADASRLSFSFQGSDGESGIREYLYAIGTVDDIQSVLPWTSAGLITEHTVDGLSLQEGELYLISVRAHDQAANVASGISDGIRPDVTAPAIAFLEDDDVTALTDRLSASWHATDNLSGIEKYRFAIGSAPGAADVHAWTSVGTNTSVTVTGLALQEGATYYFSLRAFDVAGNKSTAYSDGVRIDTSPPLINNVSVGSITGTSATVRWETSKPTEGFIDYGISNAYGSRVNEYGFADGHAVLLTLLAPGTTYHYRITARDDAGTPVSTGDLTFTTLDEADRHRRLSPAGVSYVDPEILQSEAKMTFRLGNGDIWVGDLDRSTGGFVSATGRDYRMDTGSETGSSMNGPEFGVDTGGWAVFYSKRYQNEVQIWRSTWAGGAQPEVLTRGVRHQTAMPTNNPALPETRVANIIGSWEEGGDIAWFREGSPGIQHVFGQADGGRTNRNPGRWMDDGTRIVMVDSSTGQLFILDTDSGARTDITNDPGFKTAPQGWRAPEYGEETIVTAVIDDNTIGVYRDLGAPYWTRVSTLTVPIESDQTVMSSPEPFVAGGRSYLVLSIKDRRTGDGESEAGEIWIFDLDDDPRTRFAERCDDGRAPLVRTDPEAFVGDDHAYVYYNLETEAGMREMWMCRSSIAAQDSHPVVDTDGGLVQGITREGADGFLGIPFAAPPVGALRWRRPVAAPGWSDVHQASRFAPVCPQPDPEQPDRAIIGEEDCLYLNVWTPQDRQPGQTLPVMVFVHGGANRTGGTSAPLSEVLVLDDDAPVFDGARIAVRGDVVVVTTGYRLAALGYLTHPDLASENPSRTSGNYGLRDLIQALAWVQRNIAAFGGDPAKVMLFGQSAGAHDVGVLVASQLAAGLFSSALMQSGVMQVDSAEEAAAEAAAFIEEMGLAGAPDLPDALRALPLEWIVLAQSARPIGYGLFAFAPHLDDHVVEAQPLDVVQAGAHNAVPFIIGTNAEEYAHDFEDLTYQEFLELASALVPGDHLPELYQLYPLTDFATPTEAYVAMLTDRNLTCSSRQIARVVRQKQAAPVYRYHFRRTLSTEARKADGAYHGSELLYVFQHMDGQRFSANNDDRAVEALMLNYWTRLAASGDPNHPANPSWPVYDVDSDLYLILDVNPAAATYLSSERCDFWDIVREN